MNFLQNKIISIKNLLPLKSYSPQNKNNSNGNNSPTDASGASDSDTDSTASSSNGTPSLNINFQRTTKAPPYCNGQYPHKVLTNLNQLRSQSRFCDVDIVAGGATHAAHRVVLSAASAYFEAMFRPELGLNEVNQKTVVLHEIDGDILNILLDFIYTGRCEITQSNVQELLTAADMLQLHEVVDGCCEFLCRELHASNALGILRFAEAHNCEALTKSALNFVAANFPAISQEEEFLERPKHLLSQLFAKLPKKSLYIIAGLRGKGSAVSSEDHDGFDTVDTVSKFDILRREWTETAPMEIGRYSPGVAALNGKIYVFGGNKRGGETLANGDVYDPQNNCWSAIASMGSPRSNFSLCAIDNSLYAVGLWMEGEGLVVERFDPDKDVWQITGYLPEVVRTNMRVISFEGLIYIIGGLCLSSYTYPPDLVRYNPVTQELQNLASMQVGRAFMGVAILDRYLYVVGGYNRHRGYSGSVERYSFDDNTWSIVSTMSVPRALAAVAAADGLLYVAGGQSVNAGTVLDCYSTAVECYDPSTDTWKNYPDLPVGRSGAFAIIV